METFSVSKVSLEKDLLFWEKEIPVSLLKTNEQRFYFIKLKIILLNFLDSSYCGIDWGYHQHNRLIY